MSMTYKILWIEDDEDWVDSLDIEVIHNHIGGYGFSADIEFRTSEEEINMDVDGMLYDLIVIDYNITNDDKKNGAQVIRSVRESQCLTDVIFYSGKSISELRQQALEKQLDGVFFSARENEHLLFKVCQLFDLNVKHLMSVDNVRGLVMSGVADLDSSLINIINNFNDKIAEPQKLEFRRNIVNKLAPKYTELKKFYISDNEIVRGAFKNISIECNKLEPNILKELIGNRAFSSSKRVESLITLCKYKNIDKDHRELIDNIKNLLKWRNALAHQTPEIRNNIKYFEIDRVMKPFDVDESKRILHQLRDLDNVLNSFSDAIGELK